MAILTEKSLVLFNRFAALAESVSTQEELEKLLLHLTDKIGMKGVTWLWGLHPHWKGFDTRPAEWMKKYVENNMQQNDPILHGSELIGRRPLVWSRYVNEIQLTPADRGVMEHAAKNGLVDGVLFPAFPDKPIKSGISFYTDSKQQAGLVADHHSKSLLLISDYLADLGEKIYDGYRDVIEQERPPERERKALMAASRIKGHRDQAASLHIAVPTLKDALASVRARLHAVSTEEAISIAQDRGYISR